MRGVALAALVALTSGCIGYNPSAKRWAYAGNAVFIAGGAGAIAADIVNKPEACTGPGCTDYDPAFGGAMVAGTMLVAAGVIGMIITATRTPVKTSR